MFEDNETAVSRKETEAISWEELTGLSGNIVREIRQTHELARKIIPPFQPSSMDMMKSELNMVNTMKSSLVAGSDLSSLAMDAVRASSLAMEMVTPSLLAMDTKIFSLVTEVVKPSLLAMDAKIFSLVTEVVKPSLLAMDAKISSLAMEMVKPPLWVTDAIKFSLATDMVKPPLWAMDAKISSLVMEMVKPSLLAMNAVKSSLVGDMVKSSLLAVDAVGVSSFSGSLIGIGQALDWIGGATSIIGSIQAWMPYNFKRIEEKLRLRILAAFERAGLCLAPSMSEELMHQIAYYEERGDLRPVTLLVWRYYAEHDHARLRTAVSGWRNNPEFAARWHFFDAALKTHILKIYESSVSTLLPHIEGIANTFVYANVLKGGLNNGEPRLGKTEAVILYMLNIAGDVPNLDANVSGFKGWIMVKSILQYVQNALCRFIQFGQDFGNVRKSHELHRHGALHGIQLAHTTPMNSLRLFLLLDSIHYILESYNNNGKVIW